MEDSAKPNRTIVYVDGFNLYFGMRDANLRHCYWLDVRQLATRLAGKSHRLEFTKYFTARIAGARPGDAPAVSAEREAKRLRQKCYLDALGNIRWLAIIEGKYLVKRTRCDRCNGDFMHPEEKMTDVNIATELLVDAYHDRFDSAIIVSGDGDLAPPITALRNDLPHKNLIVAFPPRRFSFELTRVATRTLDVYRSVLEKCQMPDRVELPGGIVRERPADWH